MPGAAVSSGMKPPPSSQNTSKCLAVASTLYLPISSLPNATSRSDPAAPPAPASASKNTWIGTENEPK